VTRFYKWSGTTVAIDSFLKMHLWKWLLFLGVDDAITSPAPIYILQEQCPKNTFLGTGDGRTRPYKYSH